MAHLIRQQSTRPVPEGAERVTVKGVPSVRLPGPGKRAQTFPLSKCGTRYRAPSAKWYGVYRDASGVTRRVPLSPNKDAARVMLGKLVAGAALGEAGLSDPFARHRRAPLDSHLGDYERSITERGKTAKQAGQASARCRAAFESCGFLALADCRAEPVSAWLAGRRTLTREEGGLSAQTSNHYVAALRAFGAWLAKSKRVGANPFADLSKVNAEADTRHRRRALSADEFAALVAAAEKGTPFRKTAGPDRAVLYRVAAATGFRASELASLTPESFDLTPGAATATVEARDTKNGKRGVVPVADDLAGLLRDYLHGRPAGRPVWPGKWALHNEAVDLIKRDLAAARADYLQGDADGAELARREESDFCAYRDRLGEVFDFHSLRHQFITGLHRADVNPATVQRLARHSDGRLTMRYTHVGMDGMRDAIAKLAAATGANLAGPVTLPRYTSRRERAGIIGDDQDSGRQTGDYPARRERYELQGFESDWGRFGGLGRITPSRSRTYNLRFRRRVLSGRGNRRKPLVLRHFLAVPARLMRAATWYRIPRIGTVRHPFCTGFRTGVLSLDGATLTAIMAVPRWPGKPRYGVGIFPSWRASQSCADYWIGVKPHCGVYHI